MGNDTWRDSVYVKSRSMHECSCRLRVPSSVGKLHGEICYRSEFTVGCEEAGWCGDGAEGAMAAIRPTGFQLS